MYKIVGSIIFSFILSLIISVAKAQDVMQQVFQEKTSVWEKSFEGNITNFAFAKDNGSLVVSTVERDGTYINYYDASGKTLLRKKFTDKRGGGVGISDNGKIIFATAGTGAEFLSENFVFHQDGTLLWKEISKKMLFPSPDGNYFTYQLAGGDASGHEFQIYTKTGLPLWNELPAELSEGSFSIRFIDNNRVLVFKSVESKNVQKLMMIRIPELTIEWEYVLNTPVWLLNYNLYNTSHMGNSIVFVGRGVDRVSAPTTILSIREDGTLVWKKQDIWHADKVELSHDQKYVLIYDGTGGAGKYYLIDNRTGNVLVDYTLPLPFTTLNFFAIYKNKLMLSGRTFEGSITRYYILDENFNISQEYKENGAVSSVILTKHIVFVKGFSKPESKAIQVISIIRRK